VSNTLADMNSVSWRDYVDTRLLTVENRLREQSDVHQVAIDRANYVLEKRLWGLSDFKTAMESQRGTYIPRVEFDTKFDGVNGDVDMLRADLTNIRVSLMPRIEIEKRIGGSEQEIVSLRKIVFIGLGAVVTIQFLLTVFGSSIFGQWGV